MVTYLLIAAVCATANHLGLIAAIEKVVGHNLPIVNCPRCSAFWLTLAYGCYTAERISPETVIIIVAIALLMAYIAIWMELALGIIDTLFTYIYDKVFATNHSALPADTRRSATHSAGDSADDGTEHP